MRTALLATLLLALAATALGFEATVEGYRVQVGGKLPAQGEAVAVDFALYEATLGPDKGVVASGCAVSRLPHEWYQVTITIRFWDVYRDRNQLFERAYAKVVLDKPVPGKRVRWRAILWSPHMKDTVEPFNQPNPIYTVHVEVQPAKARAAGVD